MDAAMKIAVVLTAFDKMSSVINGATDNAEKRMRSLMTKNFAEGGGMFAAGIGLAKSLEPAISAYSKLEDANTSLRASMMDNTGAVQKFNEISKLAETLGDKLPGATKDFSEMFEVMMSNGVKSQSILDGLGKAASYLAVDLKMPFAAAGEFAARMKEATGVADKDMMKFMDTMSRLKSLGVGADEMRYAFSRSAGTLKMLGLQGLQASNEMGVLYASLIRGGMSGETAATSFNNIMQNLLDKNKFDTFSDMAKRMGMAFQFFDTDGKFMGVENLVKQFDKLQGLATTKKASLVQALTGGGADGQALNSIIQNGAAGFAKMRSEMQQKASLNDKVNEKLKTLSAMWEATTGTIENMLAAIGAGLAPVLKPIVDMIGKIAGHLKVWFSENQRMAKFLTMVVGLSSAALMLAGLIKIIAGIRVAMQLLNITMAANPFIAFVMGAILVGSLLYAYWDKIRPWFGRLWANVKRIFGVAWEWIKNLFIAFTPLGIIIKHWSVIAPYFAGLWGKVKGIFWGVVSWVFNLHTTFFNAGKNIILSVWNGIKAFASKPIEAIKSMVGKIRNLLPFSPAKDGPLRDIHRIRLVETIAESVKPNALVNKMRSISQMAFDVMSRKPGRSLGTGGGSSAIGGGPVHFHITLHGSASEGDAETVIKKIKRELPTWLKQINNQQARVSFS